MPHSFDPTMYGSANDGHNGIVLRYLGNFCGRRQPNPLIKAVQRLYREQPELLQGVVIELVGGYGAFPHLCFKPCPQAYSVYAASGLQDFFGTYGERRFVAVIDAPFEQSVFLPSKLVNYMGAQRPIFEITPPGMSARLVSDLGGLVAHPNDLDEIAAKLADRSRGCACPEGGGAIILR